MERTAQEEKAGAFLSFSVQALKVTKGMYVRCDETGGKFLRVYDVAHSKSGMHKTFKTLMMVKTDEGTPIKIFMKGSDRIEVHEPPPKGKAKEKKAETEVECPRDGTSM